MNPHELEKQARSMDLPRSKAAERMYGQLVRWLPRIKPSLETVVKPGGDIRIKVPAMRFSRELTGLTLWFAPKSKQTYYSAKKDVLYIGAYRYIADGGQGEPWEIALLLAKQAKSNIIHELTHFLDNQRMGEGWDEASKSYPDPKKDPVGYFNHPIELNAYFMQGLAGASEETQEALRDISKGNLGEDSHFLGRWALRDWLQDETFTKFLKKFWRAMPRGVAENLTRENKKRLEGRAYQAWDDLRDEGRELWKDLMQEDPKLKPLKRAHASAERVATRWLRST
jgi:hypothetical protein